MPNNARAHPKPPTWIRQRPLEPRPSTVHPPQLHAEPNARDQRVQGGPLGRPIRLLEFPNVSVSRGTDEPFERIGAPRIDAVGWA
jgi:hypothetical protein